MLGQLPSSATQGVVGTSTSHPTQEEPGAWMAFPRWVGLTTVLCLPVLAGAAFTKFNPPNGVHGTGLLDAYTAWHDSQVLDPSCNVPSLVFTSRAEKLYQHQHRVWG
eukprot:g57428.t1